MVASIKTIVEKSDEVLNNFIDIDSAVLKIRENMSEAVDNAEVKFVKTIQ